MASFESLRNEDTSLSSQEFKRGRMNVHDCAWNAKNKIICGAFQSQYTFFTLQIIISVWGNSV